MLKPTKTANTIDILISIIINGFVVTGCPIPYHLAFSLMQARLNGDSLSGIPHETIGSCFH